MRTDHSTTFFALLLILFSGAAAADPVVVQCTVETHRSSFSPRPDLFTIQVDLDARVITTYYGTMPLKVRRAELRGAGPVDGGWQSSVSIDRNSGRLEAGIDKIERGKYSYAALKGICILPQALQGARYRSPAAQAKP